MKLPFFLIVGKRGSVRINKSVPRLDWDEVSIGITLEIPDKIFQRPALQATISIPEDAVNKNPITAEVKDNVADAIEQATGLKFLISVEGSEKAA